MSNTDLITLHRSVMEISLNDIIPGGSSKRCRVYIKALNQELKEENPSISIILDWGGKILRQYRRIARQAKDKLDPAAQFFQLLSERFEIIEHVDGEGLPNLQDCGCHRRDSVYLYVASEKEECSLVYASHVFDAICTAASRFCLSFSFRKIN